MGRGSQFAGDGGQVSSTRDAEVDTLVEWEAEGDVCWTLVQKTGTCFGSVSGFKIITGKISREFRKLSQER